MVSEKEKIWDEWKVEALWVNTKLSSIISVWIIWCPRTPSKLNIPEWLIAPKYLNDDLHVEFGVKNASQSSSSKDVFTLGNDHKSGVAKLVKAI